MSEWVSEWVTGSLSYLPLRNVKPLLHPARVSKSVALRGQVAAASGLSSNSALRDSDKSTGEQKGSRQFAAPADVRFHQNVWNSLTLDGFIIGCKMQPHCFWVCPCEQRNHICHTCAIYVNKSLLHRWLMYSCLQHIPVKRLVWVQCVEHFLREGAWDPAVWRSSLHWSTLRVSLTRPPSVSSLSLWLLGADATPEWDSCLCCGEWQISTTQCYFDALLEIQCFYVLEKGQQSGRPSSFLQTSFYHPLI